MENTENKLNIEWKKGRKLGAKALTEMRFIMDGILDKTLKHKQDVWHETKFKLGKKDKDGDYSESGYVCGTSHCFAGWGEFFAFKAKMERKPFFEVTTEHTPAVKEAIEAHEYTIFNKEYHDAGQYCQKRWKLNDEEAAKLFLYTNTKKDLNYIVTMLEQGYRMDENYGW